MKGTQRMDIGLKSRDGAPLSAASESSSRQRKRRIKLPSLRMRVSERKILLFAIDLLLVNLALIGGRALGLRLFAPDVPQAWLPKWSITLSLLWPLVAIFFDSYNLARAASFFYSVRSITAAALATILIYALIPVLTPPLLSRGVIFFFAGLAATGLAGWRFIYARLFEQPWFTQRALVVGAGNAGQALADALATHPDDANPFRGTGYQLVGFVDDDPLCHHQEIAGVPVLAGHEQLVYLAQRLEVDEIVLAITHRHAISQDLFDALLRCREMGFRVIIMSVLYERLLGRVPVDHIGRDLQMVVPMEASAAERFYRLIKRVSDILIAGVGLVALALIIPIVAAVNALTSPGPLFYRQRRVGYGGRPFEMLKFRSMIPDAEKESGAVWACENDDRITPLGRLLRHTRLDEVPQIINVLKGEMSIIGPRPERPEFVEQLARELPFYRARHAVRPGITGWAQVQYDYGDCVEDAKIKLEYDLYYVKNMSLWLDLRILLQTVPVMLQLRGQ